MKIQEIHVISALSQAPEAGILDRGTNNRLSRHGLLLAGIRNQAPVFLDSVLKIVWLPTLYLSFVSTLLAADLKSETIRTYSESLVDWLRFLATARVALKDATREHLIAYRNQMLSQPSGRTGRPLSGNTINARVLSAARMHEWGAEARLVDSGWHPRQPAATTRFGIRYRRPTGSRLAVKASSSIPRVVTLVQFQRLLAELDQTAGLMAKWMLTAGLRRKEVCELELGSIPDVSQLDPLEHPLIEVRLRRKGGQRTKVMVPFLLAEESNWYALATRPKPASSLSAQPLFLSSRGKAFNPDRLGQLIAQAGRRASIDIRPHGLRHTFAILVLQLLQQASARGAQINPLKTLQVLLNHRSLESTAIYLRALELQSEEVINTLEYLYGGALTKDEGLAAWIPSS